MSAGTQKRQQALAVAVYKLRMLGFTNRDIARTHSIDVKRVPELATLGERLNSIRTK